MYIHGAVHKFLLLTLLATIHYVCMYVFAALWGDLCGGVPFGAMGVDELIQQQVPW